MPTRPPPSTSLPTRAAWASSASGKVWHGCHPTPLASHPHLRRFWADLPMVTGLHPTPGLTELLGRVISHPRLPPRRPLQAGRAPLPIGLGADAAHRTRNLPLSAPPPPHPTPPPRAFPHSSAHPDPVCLALLYPSVSPFSIPSPQPPPVACGTLPCFSFLGCRPQQASCSLTSSSFIPPSRFLSLSVPQASCQKRS